MRRSRVSLIVVRLSTVGLGRGPQLPRPVAYRAAARGRTTGPSGSRRLLDHPPRRSSDTVPHNSAATQDCHHGPVGVTARGVCKDGSPCRCMFCLSDGRMGVKCSLPSRALSRRSHDAQTTREQGLVPTEQRVPTELAKTYGIPSTSLRSVRHLSVPLSCFDSANFVWQPWDKQQSPRLATAWTVLVEIMRDGIVHSAGEVVTRMTTAGNVPLTRRTAVKLLDDCCDAGFLRWGPQGIKPTTIGRVAMRKLGR